MAAVQRTKKQRTLLKYLKLAVIAELDMFTHLRKYFTTTSMGNVDVFKLSAKRLHFGQWNVNYLTKTKFEEVNMHRIIRKALTSW